MSVEHYFFIYNLTTVTKTPFDWGFCFGGIAWFDMFGDEREAHFFIISA